MVIWVHGDNNDTVVTWRTDVSLGTPHLPNRLPRRRAGVISLQPAPPGRPTGFRHQPRGIAEPGPFLDPKLDVLSHLRSEPRPGCRYLAG